MEQVALKDDFAEQEPRKAMVNTDTYNSVNLDRLELIWFDFLFKKLII